MKLIVFVVLFTFLSGCNSIPKPVAPHLLFHQPNDVSTDALVAQSYLLLSQEAYRLKDYDYEFELLNELADYEYGPAQLEIAKKLLKGHGKEYVHGTPLEWATKAAERDYTPAILFLAQWYRYGGDGVDVDLKEAMNLYARAIELGDYSAATELGYIFIRHWREEKGYETAQQLFANAAYHGDVKALCGLGIVYRESKKLKDLEKAADYFQVSYVRGYKECAFELGYLYHRSKPNTQQALRWYQVAAKNGSRDALNNLGMMYNNGDGVDIDYSRAKSYFEQAVELGSRLSFGNLGSLYELGKGVEQDYDKAVYWYQKGVDRQDAQSMHNLGTLYSLGSGVEKNREKALSLFEQAADLGNRFSAFNLANAYYYADGKEQNDELALEYYLVSARAGYAPAFCQAAEVALKDSWTLARSYFHEGAKLGQEACLKSLVKGLRANKEQDIPIVGLLKAFANRDVAFANEMLGHIYQFGEFGLFRSFEKAQAFYLKAAELGAVNAFANLGFLYEQGDLVEQNLDTAASFYQKAAELGSALGKNYLATFYLNGVVVKKDRTKAVALYQEAAELHNTAALINLGDIYLDYGSRDFQLKACALFKKAYELGAKRAAVRHSRCVVEQTGDIKSAYQLLEDSRGQDCSLCVVKQAELILNKQIEGKSQLEAFGMLQNAAQAGNAAAAYKLASLYESGGIKSQDLALAFNWYRTSVTLGEVDALNKIAEFYWAGKGVDKSEDDAVEAISQLAKAKNFNVASFVGEHFYHGVNVDIDLNKARYYFMKAAQQNDGVALNSLGVIYRDGLRVAVDTELAKDYFERSAHLGVPDAMHNLGALNLSQNKEKDGLEWLQRAAEKQFVKSYILLGDYYASHDANEESMRKAVKWLKLAADEKAPDGMYKLAMLLKKQNRNQFTIEVQMWLKAAASGGHQAAVSELKVFELQRE
ncbi:tetratricopeptide repeat protein [Pseudoalteromonas luteoviolacea]|uniref:tetratricopeptide repeat protein n=1 Tax=Pseudoalteromonas luteoviolacea TaxID=43657 RepID=UPI001B3690C2|nr:tetratricopeptide repeat protein [Pseudoalteromonas luteoviolacea]MBQ4834966.1 sel1 repeat family protein [Pseudoalteromonas luteoviolacea]